MDVGLNRQNIFKSYESFCLKLCRCGRKKQGTHLTKCMEKCLIKYSESETVDESKTNGTPNIPKTTNAIHGFFPCKYLQLERSTHHVSTKRILKHKITESLYDNIIIG